MALFAVAVCAVLVATALTVVVLTDRGPERAEPGAVAAVGSRPSPTTRTSSARPVSGLPACLIGTWRTVDESFMIKFYTDQPELPMTGAGRVFEFRPDGTGTQREDNVVISGNFRGNQIRFVGTGTIDFTWTADARTITYKAQTAATLTYAYYDQRGHLSTQPVTPNPNLNEVDNYQCEGARMSESNDHGYRSSGVRVGGTYG